MTDPQFHATPPTQVLAQLEVRADAGLADAEAHRRLQEHGPNALREHQGPPWWRILLAQLKSTIVALLLLAALVAWAFGEHVEATAILAVISVNTLIGFFTELRAVRSMEALRKLGRVRTRVRRGGEEREIGAQQLVPGDIVLLEGGDVVTADLRLVEASRVEADEAILTGESVPVAKSPEAVSQEATLPERSSMVFKGTALTRGAGTGVVVRTGMTTELGRIAALTAEAEDELTPLEQRLDNLGSQLLGVTAMVVLVVTVGGIASGRDLYMMLEMGISLAVATVPEGLPIVATMALARGMWRLAQRNALISSLAAVETLGATTVILTDKTGTLTRNRLRWTVAALADGEVARGPGGEFLRGDEPVQEPRAGELGRLLEAGALCSDAALNQEGVGVGDPLEVALLEAAAAAGVPRAELLEKYPEVREDAFDSETRRMATTHGAGGGFRIFVKGAPEAVLTSCVAVASPAGDTPLDGPARERWETANADLARRGLRVLAFATREDESVDGDPYADLTLLGLVGLEDPPRDDVAGALATCHRAGVRVVMVTGDQRITAESVGRAIGLLPPEEEARVVTGGDLGEPGTWDDTTRERLLEARVFARMSPEQKLRILEVFQESGEVVAMTGDGVNDAPALKKADIGIAMGLRGTQVAQEASDLVLLDDTFPTIVLAMAQGRVILGNIRNFLVYLLSCNLAEILLIGFAGALGKPLPILPLQILYLNLVTDVFPAFALGFGEEEGDVMSRPPRDPKVPILERRHWTRVAGYGFLLAVSTLAAFLLELSRAPSGDPAAAIAVAFATLSLGQSLHVFNMRDAGASWVSNEVTRNPFVWWAILACLALTLVALATPGLSEVLKLAVPDASGWGLIATFAVAPLALGGLVRRITG